MKIRSWYVGRNDSKIGGIPDSQVLEEFACAKVLAEKNSLRLVGITATGARIWTLDQELKEMKGHLFGLVRSKYGREMLDARKAAILESVRLGLRPSVK